LFINLRINDKKNINNNPMIKYFGMVAKRLKFSYKNG